MLANDSASEYGLLAGVARPYSSFVRRVDHASPIHRVAFHRVAFHRMAFHGVAIHRAESRWM